MCEPFNIKLKALSTIQIRSDCQPFCITELYGDKHANAMDAQVSHKDLGDVILGCSSGGLVVLGV